MRRTGACAIASDLSLLGVLYDGRINTSLTAFPFELRTYFVSKTSGVRLDHAS